MKFHKVAFGLLIIGGLNWLLFGLFGKDLFGLLGMSMTGTLARIVYILVGAAAICEVMCHKSLCKMCGMGKMGNNSNSMGGMGNNTGNRQM